MGELGFGMILDVPFKQIPIAFIIADFFAIRADGQQPAQGVDPGNSLLQLRDIQSDSPAFPAQYWKVAGYI